eukprot:3933375-Rhodomonas_salina.2
MLKASRQFPEDEDDCLSVASTFVGDDHSEASTVRSFRSAGSRRSMDDFVAEVPMPSTRSTGSIKGSTGISSKPTNRRPVRFENIRKVAVVGKGNSGIVWRCIDKSNCDPLALKEVISAPLPSVFAEFDVLRTFSSTDVAALSLARCRWMTTRRKQRWQCGSW